MPTLCLRRVRDFAQVKGSGIIDLEITRYGLKALNIDQHGLDEMDNRILSVIIDKFNGGPVGLQQYQQLLVKRAEQLKRYMNHSL